MIYVDRKPGVKLVTDPVPAPPTDWEKFYAELAAHRASQK
jgi:hypothetical protein